MNLLRLIFDRGGLVEQLRRAYEAKLAAHTDGDRLAAEAQIEALKIAQANRLADPGNRGLQAAIAIIALAVALHFAAVAFVSAVPQWGWTVHALPGPMADWQGQIILGFFGLAAVARIFRR